MSGLEISSDSDPFSAFGAWFEEAWRVETGEAQAMALATADARGRVSSRIVLLKDWGRGGFVFFTNYGSRKARALAENPCAALLFHWRVLGRQVRIEGSVVRASEEDSDAYFASRPVEARLGAWASRQSEVLPSRDILEARIAEQTQRWGGGAIARPAFWGGYVLRAQRFEFWCNGGDSRLHDRFVFEKGEEKKGGEKKGGEKKGDEEKFSGRRLYP